MIVDIDSLIERVDDLKIASAAKKAFTDRLRQGRITKSENPVDHCCSFLVPVHRESRSLFVGHHIKADEWIPPGGHMELGERPEDTVRREFTEELSSTIHHERLELFNVSIMQIVDPKRACRTHNDFWYAIFMDSKEPFVFDRGEFYDAEWLPIDEAIKRARRPVIIDSLRLLKNKLSP